MAPGTAESWTGPGRGLARQSGNPVLGQADGFVKGGEFGFRGCAARMGTVLCCLGLKPFYAALGDQPFGFSAHPRCAFRGIAVGIKLIEIGIGRYDRLGECQARRSFFGPGSVNIGRGSGKQCSVLAEEVQLPIQTQPDGAGVLPAMAHVPMRISAHLR